MNSKIHPTASIHPSAVIGEGVEIGPETIVGAHAVIEHAVIGAKCRISPHAVLGGLAQDLQNWEEKTRLIVGNNCIIRECVTLNRGTFKPGCDGTTRIGNNCFFMAYSHAGHDCRVEDGVILTNSVALGGHVSVGRNAVLGGLAAVHQFVRIGAFTMIGGLSGVDRDVPPFCMAQGIRIGLVGLNLVGLRRGGFPRDAISQVKNAYRTLFSSSLRLEEALRKLESQDGASGALQELIAFLKAPSKRGIARPRTEREEASAAAD